MQVLGFSKSLSSLPCQTPSQENAVPPDTPEIATLNHTMEVQHKLKSSPTSSAMAHWKDIYCVYKYIHYGIYIHTYIYIYI